MLFRWWICEFLGPKKRASTWFNSKIDGTDEHLKKKGQSSWNIRRFPKINGKTNGLEQPYFRKRPYIYERMRCLLWEHVGQVVWKVYWPELRSGDVALPEACVTWISQAEMGLPVPPQKISRDISTVEDEDSLGVWKWTMYQRPIFLTRSYFYASFFQGKGIQLDGRWAEICIPRQPGDFWFLGVPPT